VVLSRATIRGGGLEARVEAGANSILGTSFYLLWAGQFVSQLGDRFAMIAFPLLVYGTTKSAFNTGVALALYTLPYVLFGTIAGVLIDRLNKRRSMITADVLRACIVMAVPFAASHSLALVYVLGFCLASVGVFFDPCKLAVVPELVPSGLLMRANSVLATGETLTEIIGFAAGGYATYYLSRRTVFGIDAATFVVSGIALSAMRYAPRVRPAATDRAKSVLSEIREGLSFLRHHRGLTANTALVLIGALGIGATLPLTFVFAMALPGRAKALGILESSFALGFLLGSLLMATFGTRARVSWTTTLGLFAMGCAYAAVSMTHSLTAAIVPFFAAGAADAVFMISIDTFFQRTIPEHLRGRVLGVRFTLTQGFFALSVLLGGAAAGVINVRVLFIVAGCIVALPGLAGLLLPSLRRD
jgi:MFS transporter, DHA3 family, macrolide efflux protein